MTEGLAHAPGFSPGGSTDRSLILALDPGPHLALGLPLVAGETPDAALRCFSQCNRWMPRLQRVEAEVLRPHSSLWGPGAWEIGSYRVLEELRPEDLFGPEAARMDTYVEAIGSLSREAWAYAHATPQLLVLLGRTWDLAKATERTSTYTFTSEAFLKDRSDGRDSAFREAWKAGLIGELDTYRLRAVLAALAVFDALTAEQRELTERSFQAITGG